MFFDPMLLRQARETQRLSQETMARRAEVSVSTYSKYESGAITPTTRMLGRLASLLGCRVDDFFAVEGVSPADLAALREAVDALPPLGPDDIDKIATILASVPRMSEAS